MAAFSSEKGQFVLVRNVGINLLYVHVIVEADKIGPDFQKKAPFSDLETFLTFFDLKTEAFV